MERFTTKKKNRNFFRNSLVVALPITFFTSHLALLYNAISTIRLFLLYTRRNTSGAQLFHISFFSLSLSSIVVWENRKKAHTKIFHFVLFFSLSVHIFSSMRRQLTFLIVAQETELLLVLPFPSQIFHVIFFIIITYYTGYSFIYSFVDVLYKMFRFSKLFTHKTHTCLYYIYYHPCNSSIELQFDR